MQFITKKVKGNIYYYAEQSIRLEKIKNYYIFIGKKKPSEKDRKKYELKLLDKIYSDLLGNKQRIYLSKLELIEVEKKRRKYEAKLKGLSKGQRSEKEELETVDFVYTTLTTEGVPATRTEAVIAFDASQKNIKVLRDENIQISLDMINGLRKVRESKPGLTIEFIKNLHKTIMNTRKDKHPGEFRRKPANIYYNGEKIDFQPTNYNQINKKLEQLVNGYNTNYSKLNSIELAALLHLKFYKIHPFEDGNKRTSRLLLNKALHDSNYPLLNISRNKQEYFDALVKSVEHNKDKPFTQFTLNEFLKQTK